MDFLTNIDYGLSHVLWLELEIRKQSGGYTDQGLFWPTTEPVQSATID